MKIPAEFEDIFRGVELTEREALFLSWITSWDDYTVQNMRTVVEKVRSALSTLQAENEKLRAELEQVKRCIEIIEKQRDAAIRDLKMVAVCDTCVHEHEPSCPGCNDAENWQWRGQKEGY